MTPQRFETEDLTFVTVLRMDGIVHQSMEQRNGGCRWIYDGPVVAHILETLNDYNEDQCEVEPREFTKKMGMLRQEMYQFLNYKPPRVRAAS